MSTIMNVDYKKRLLALLLAILMVFGVMPNSPKVYAAESGVAIVFTDYYTDEAVKGVSVVYSVTAVGVDVSGTDFSNIVINSASATADNGNALLISEEEYNNLTTVEGVTGLKVSYTASCPGYKTASAENIAIDLATADVVQKLNPEINDITIAGENLVFDGKNHKLVKVDAKDGDIVTYEVNGGNPTEVVPSATDADTYSIKVTVGRENCEPYVKTVSSVISKADRKISLSANELRYDGSEQELVSVTGIESWDRYEFTVDGIKQSGTDIPKASGVKKYTVTLDVSGSDNYNSYTNSVTVNLQEGIIDLGNLNVTALDCIYDGSAHPLLEVVTDSDFDCSIKYSVDGSAYSESIPSATDADTYKVYVKAEKSNYEDKIVEYVAKISKADQSFNFNNYEKGKETTVNVAADTLASGITYEFSATDAQKLVGEAITYEVTEGDDIALVTSDGDLTVTEPGTVVVTATLPGNKNYNECKISHTLKIVAEAPYEGSFINFDENRIIYIFGENDGVVGTITANLSDSDIDGEITYEISGDIGLSCNSDSGKVYISDYKKLAEVIEDGDATVTVTATKAAGVKYGKDSASYSITVNFLIINDNILTYEGNRTEVGNDWYISDVTVEASNSDLYITKADDFSFAEKVIYEESGIYTIYLRQGNSGGITAPVKTKEIKIDRNDPVDLKIDFSNVATAEKLGGKFSFYNPDVTIKFTAKDSESGIDEFRWVYEKESDAGNTIENYLEGVLSGADISYDSITDIYSARLTLPLREAMAIRGNIGFIAVDNAGNESDRVTEETIIIVDKASPSIDVEYELVDASNVYLSGTDAHYYSGDIKVTVKIEEENFFEELVELKVAKNGETPVEQSVEWSNVSGTDLYIASFELNDDGRYVVSANYIDYSKGGEKVSYTSKNKVIDKTNPVVEFKFDSSTQTTKVTITEANFDAKKISVIGTVTDLNDKTITETSADIIEYAMQNASWELSGTDTYVLETGDYKNGIYKLNINYTDIVNRSDDVDAFFKIDNGMPENVKITYSEPIDKTTINNQTHWIYNNDITVTLSATDKITGVDSFAYAYEKEGVYATVIESATADSEDGSMFTASFVLSTSDVIFSKFAAMATDKYGNKSRSVNDTENVLVIDKTKPEIEVLYNGAEWQEYYQDDVTVTVKVTEKYFDEDAMSIVVSGGDISAVDWKLSSEDVYVAEFKLTGEGKCGVAVSGTDIAKNIMTNYSASLIIDKTDPVLEFNFDTSTQQTTFTVKESNFDASGITVKGTVTDMNGDSVDATTMEEITEMLQNASWILSGSDTYVFTTGEYENGRYNIIIEYVDKAERKATKISGKFNINNSAPVNVGIAYSEPVNKVEVNNETYWFYNSDVDVTYAAEDKFIAIDKFIWKYSQIGTGAKKGSSAAIASVDDSSKFTAVLTIPSETDARYENFAVSAADVYGNYSEVKIDPVNVIVVDKTKPEMTVSYSDSYNYNGEAYYYSDSDCVVKLTITEDNFFSDEVVTTMTKDNVAYDCKVNWVSNEGTFKLSEDGSYTVTVNYTDYSGNKMEEYNAEIVIDGTAPTLTATYSNVKEIEGIYYCNASESDVTLDISERYFFDEDVQVTVTKDGAAYGNYSVSWNDISGTDHRGTFTLSEEGDYDITVKYTDRAGNVMEDYTSKLVIDRTNPVIEVSYTDSMKKVRTVDGIEYYAGERTAVIKITEKHFSDTDAYVSVNISETDVEGTKVAASTVAVSDWSVAGESVYECTVVFSGDANYTFDVSCMDLAGNTTERTETDFTVDKTDPEVVSIRYSDAEKVITSDNVPTRYYNDKVEITITASDLTAGVHSFRYEYDGEVSVVNAHLIKKAIENAEIKRDGKYASITITVPEKVLDEKNQLKGIVSVVVEDRSGNDSIHTEEEAIIADNIAPVVEITYNESISTADDVVYYDGSIEGTISVKETNFFSGDVKVEITKDGKTYSNYNVSWSDMVGTFTLNEEGHYIVTVNYSDRSGNIMTDKNGNAMNPYKSSEMVIDKTAPVMEISYNECVSEADSVVYYDGSIEGTITVTETNFFSEDVEVGITRDGEVYSGYTVTWNDRVGTFTITEEGHYFVTVSYSDRSGRVMTDKNGNEMNPYKSLEMVVDGTAPVVEITYNECVSEADSVVYYDGSIEGTITVTETNFFSEDVEVEITKDGEVYSGYTVIWNDRVGTFTITEEGHYFVTVSYSDRSDRVMTDKNGNAMNPYKSYEMVIDKTAPVVEITYNECVSTADSVAYYDGSIESKITVTETNFFSEDVKVEITKDGEVYIGYSVTWNDRVGIFTLTEEGHYFVTVSYSDRSGNVMTDKNGNEMNPYMSSEMVIDETAPTLEVTYNEDYRIVEDVYYYSDSDCVVTLDFIERNFFSKDVQITVTRDGLDYNGYEVIWNSTDETNHTGTFALEEEGDYEIAVKYTDRSENAMEDYDSKIVIDRTNPVIEILYTDSPNKVRTENGREYYAGKRTAVITVSERHFSDTDAYVSVNIAEKDINGEDVATSTVSVSDWISTDKENTYECTVVFNGDANYTFDVICTDLSRNTTEREETDFTVDKTKPYGLKITYSDPIKIYNDKINFYNDKMTVKIAAYDDTSGIYAFDYSYILGDGVSEVNAELIDQAIASAQIKRDGNMSYATFNIPKAVLTKNNQFNGNVEFAAIDRSDNSSNLTDDKITIVVDNIAPTAQVSFSKPINVEGGTSYYNGNIITTLTVTEANFYAQDVDVFVSKNGGSPYKVTPTWKNNSVDVHVGTFTITGDGDYIVTIKYSDKSTNSMATYTSKKMTIDTVIELPTITINGKSANGKAFKDQVVPAISFNDINYAGCEVMLTRTNYGSKNLNVKNLFIGNRVSVNATGGSGTFDTFDKIAENDGIYTLTVKIRDKAGHSSSTTVKFTVNRFGSVYEYSDYLTNLIADGGAYVENIDEDIVITEINADKLLEDSLNIEITRDGKPIDDVHFTVSPEINNSVRVGDSGWYQYRYTINKENFAADGIYKVSVSSKDATGNSPENSSYNDKLILFRVDKTAPEINSVVGLEESIVNAQEVTVRYSVFDVIGLKSVRIFVDGRQIGDIITDFGPDVNNYSGSFVLTENTSAQNIQIVVEDLSGNTIDTNSDDFTSAYAFNKSVTVSTNFFVRWYANKPLFWGSMAGVTLVGTFFFIILAKRRKKDEE